jgi:hypothetical protein
MCLLHHDHRLGFLDALLKDNDLLLDLRNLALLALRSTRSPGFGIPVEMFMQFLQFRVDLCLNLCLHSFAFNELSLFREFVVDILIQIRHLFVEVSDSFGFFQTSNRSCPIGVLESHRRGLAAHGH